MGIRGVALCLAAATLLSSLGATSVGTALQSNWSFEVVDSFGLTGGCPSLAIDRFGDVHIAYWRIDVPIIRYAHKIGTSWTLEDVTPTDRVSCASLSLTLDAADKPVIAYTNGSQLTYLSKVFGVWTPERVDRGYFILGGVLVNATGFPSIAYWDRQDWNVKFAWKNATVWATELVEWTGTVGPGLSAVLAPDGTGRLVYMDITRSSLKYASRETGTWTVAEWDPGSASDPDLAFDSSGKPWIAFDESVGGNDYTRLGRPIGDSWEVVDPAIAGRGVRLALDSKDWPRFVYAPSDTVWFARWHGSGWSSEYLAGPSIDFNEVAFALKNDVPHIAYHWSTRDALYYATVGTDLEPPESRVLQWPSYWNRQPASANATALDAQGYVTSVTLSYRHSLDNTSWTPWGDFGTLTDLPWQWIIGFPNGSGYYEFYSTAMDMAGNAEPPPVAGDAAAGYDAISPSSSALPIASYWQTTRPLVVNATASDNLSGVIALSLVLAYSADNESWGTSRSYGTLASPPWSWDFPFPDGEGHYRFYTIAEDAAGNSEGSKAVAEVEVAYKLPDAPPVADAVAAPTLAHLGDEITFNGAGSTDDHAVVTYFWDFGDSFSSPSPATTHAYTARGGFIVSLTVWDASGQNDTDVVSITVENRPPVADAGPDLTAPKHVPVQLNGNGSGDADDDSLLYSWSQLRGLPVVVNGANTTTPTFTPVVSGRYSFQLDVEDGWGGFASDTVDVTVGNLPPVADAGPDRLASKGAPVTLDGSGSYDPDGDDLSYSWTQDGGFPVALLNASSTVATFAPLRAGTYAFRVRVDDPEGLAAEDAIAVRVPNASPVANLSAAQLTTRVGRSVEFNASGSVDSDGAIVDFAFNFGDGALLDGTQSRVSHVYDHVGTYVVTLTVTDDDGATHVALLTITVMASFPPIAVVSVWPGESGTLDTTFALDGANSTDDVSIVSWLWDFGDGIIASGEMVEHRYHEKGRFEVTLTVKNDEAADASARLTLRVVNRPPVIIGAAPAASITLLAGQPQNFVLTAADPDNDLLTYVWSLDGAAVWMDGPSFSFTSEANVYRLNVTVSDGDLDAYYEWTVRVASPPAGPNWEPAIAAVFAAILAVAGGWSSKRRPWKDRSGRYPMFLAFALTSFPFVAAEATTGVISFATGVLTIPPLLGLAMAIDGGILSAGIATALLRTRSKGTG